MSNNGNTRRLAAILAADMVAYSRLMHENEAGTVAAWKAARRDAIDPTLEAHRGRVVKRTGDGFLAEFSIVEDAVRCAVEMQAALSDSPLAFRMGLNLGDITDDGDDIHGDGVNIAARLEGLADPGGICISSSVHDQVHNKLNLTFSDLGELALKNISRPIRAYKVLGKDEAALKVEEVVPPRKPTLPYPEKPSLAVLPFINMSGDAEQEHFADGITEDLITTLSKIEEFFVVARNSVFTFKGKPIKREEAARELGVDYILEGSVRKSGNRVRINVQLTHSGTGEHMWTDRWDRDLDDIFAIQDEITLRIAMALQVELTEGVQAKLRYTTTDNVAAWNHFIKGVSLFRTVSQPTYRQAREEYQKALMLDPGSAHIHAQLAWVYAVEGRFHWGRSVDETLALCKDHADQALVLDSENADANGSLGFWNLCLLKHDDGTKAFRRAIELAPDHADMHALFSVHLAFAEEPDEAIKEVKMAMRLSPLYPNWYLGSMGHAYRYDRQFDKALEALETYNQRAPGYGHVDVTLVYLDMGKENEAEERSKLLLYHRPDFTVDGWMVTQQCKDRDRLKRDSEGLRRIGLP